MNNFANWNDELDDDDGTKLFKRSLVIKILCEQTQPKALENIQKAQKHQKKSQNRQLNGNEDNKLQNGTNVLIKDCRLVRDKLDPKFSGKYEIVEQKQSGNYQLKNETREILADTYPRW